MALKRCLITDNKHPHIVKLQSAPIEAEAITWMVGEELGVCREFAKLQAAKKFAWTCSFWDNHVPSFGCVVLQICQSIVASHRSVP